MKDDLDYSGQIVDAQAQSAIQEVPRHANVLKSELQTMQQPQGILAVAYSEYETMRKERDANTTDLLSKQRTRPPVVLR